MPALNHTYIISRPYRDSAISSATTHILYAPAVTHMLMWEDCTYSEAIWTHWLRQEAHDLFRCWSTGLQWVRKLVFPSCTWTDDSGSLLLHWLQPDETSSFSTTTNYRTVWVRGGAGLVACSSSLCLSFTSFYINCFLSVFVLLRCVCVCVSTALRMDQM